MGWTQHTSKVVGSGPKVRVEIDSSTVLSQKLVMPPPYEGILQQRDPSVCLSHGAVA